MKKKKKQEKFKKITSKKENKEFSPIEKIKELLLFNGILYIILLGIYIFYIGFYLKGDPIAKKALNWLFGWIVGGAIIVSIYDYLYDYFYYRYKNKRIKESS